MKAIILAAGKGSRMGTYTEGKPKCMLKLGNETILERETRILQQAGIKKSDIYVVGGYKYKMLQKYAPNLIVNEDYDKKDNSYTLALALQSVHDDDVLILDSDLCFEKALIEQILTDTRKNVLLSKRSEDLEESTGIVTKNDGTVKAVGKKYINTGYVYISIFKIAQQIIPEFTELLLRQESVKTWYPLAITELCSKYDFYNLVTEEKWHEIDVVEDYIETIEMFKLEKN